ncbi:class I SAM-dependent methyltransferase [Neobacillus sp. YIM B06451]|uniref:class I SAM-dependent methyltransferase n=1 Tax=Neobacillus sp. YIM B06451 TaxID=3070994 RepID=UPI0029318AF5|nr:class I SAM-dependent methyltransferase [Neobacillus sp. YIM B06451]
MLGKETITKAEDILYMLDHLLEEKRKFNWDVFYSDRSRNIPFFEDLPDENLVHYINNDLIKPGTVLELGCGPGRNALFLAANGFSVDAVDLSDEAITWAKERASKQNLTVNFVKENIFEMKIDKNSYDLVYDSGCFHHIAPHRRLSYLELLKKALKPGGMFALTCFVPGGSLGGSDLTDWDVYREMSLSGGLGFTEEKLKQIFLDFQVVEIRRMNDTKEFFGNSNLNTALFRKNE